MHEIFAERQLVDKVEKRKIEYPYMPEEGTIEYVGPENDYMWLAKEYAKRYSLDKVMPNCSVIVKEGKILGIGANGSNYHEENGCERVRRKIPTGQGYDLCEGCHPKNHGEQQAINDAVAVMGTEDFSGAEIYLWGHYWACEPCWDAMLGSGINTVYLLEGSEVLFVRNNPDNIIGRQFEV